VICIGYHCEGWDHLILHTMLCRLLDRGEDFAVPQVIRVEHCLNVDEVLSLSAKALKKFYYQLRSLAVVLAVDNDGREDLRKTGNLQDLNHPRHWAHEGGHHGCCKQCRLTGMAETTREHLHMTGFVPGPQWPVVITVPVEAIETWLLIARGLSREGSNADLDAERRPGGSRLKMDFWGEPFATRAVVEEQALPLIRSLDDIHGIASYSRSFQLLVDQVDSLRDRIEASEELLKKSYL